MCILTKTNAFLPGLSTHRPVIAVDTEFKDTHTLMIQTAARIERDMIAVQLYRSADVPELPDDFDIHAHLPLTQEGYGRFCKLIYLRPVKMITPDLSPAVMLRDLYGISKLEVKSRLEGQEHLQHFGTPDVPGETPVPQNVTWKKKPGEWQVPSINLTLVGHFLRADFCRVFGQRFYDVLKAVRAGEQGDVVVRCRKLIEFVERKGSWQMPAPVLEYLLKGEQFYGLALEMRDTIFPYGPASLDSHSQTFLNLGKSEVLSSTEKKDMLRVANQRTADFYGYAMVDAVNTLLIHEQMQAKDQGIYHSFGYKREERTPPLRATLGSRVSTFLKKTTMRDVVAGSKKLSERKLEELMQKGGLKLFQVHGDASKYGPQTGTTHGGLLYSRSPTKFWHESKGQLRDVDMSGCYNYITGRLQLYWGRPVILEPGSKPLSLKDAVAYVQGHSAPHGWLIRVTGEIKGYHNALIPSTENAVTSTNYKQLHRAGKRRLARQRVFQLEAERDPASVHWLDKGGSKLYAQRIDSGIVTGTTLLMIQALPEGVRQQYEALTADSIIFYPSKLVARDGLHYDALLKEYGNEELPWESTLDLKDMELVQRQKIDEEYVSLAYPIGDYARKIGAFRKEAQKKEGKGSGADHAWKMHANSMYGVLASRLLPSNNFVAANQITAWARSEAFALSQSLNAIQTITDGCTYRLDQIPACTYAECLQIKPDYPIRRAEERDGVPFVDPTTIPQDDAGFTLWYRQHVQRFFGVSGEEYDAFFSTHGLEHKKTDVSKQVAFDALGCDGSGNYVKWTAQAEGGWQLEKFAARSYRDDSKAVLKDWLFKTYSQDQLTQLPPITEETSLLSYKQASQKARKALDSGIPEVVFPLGLDSQRFLNYRVIKPSAFVFGNPQQRAAILKQVQKFEDEYAAGLEMMALKRGYGKRKQGSISGVAEDLYGVIRQGAMNLKGLNLQKVPDALEKMALQRRGVLEQKKINGVLNLQQRIDTRNLDPAKLSSAYLVTANDLKEVQVEAD
jgi:hypothetical protein